MKIWIVVSDSFHNDFEKIAEQWATEDEIKITKISSYGYNLWSVLFFCITYLNFRPKVILTDHGYFGFWFIKKISALMFINTRFYFYLRGNYWLEERIRSEQGNS